MTGAVTILVERAMVGVVAVVAVKGTVVVIVVFEVAGSRQPPNQPHWRHVVTEVVIVSVVTGTVEEEVVLSS